MPQVTAYKVDTLEGVKPDSIVALKVPNEDKFELWITSRSGIPFPLKVDTTSGGINNIVNTDGELNISGSSTVTINISDTLLAIINSALQAGDNISNLVNDSGYLTSAVLPTNTSDLINDGADSNSTYVEADELGTVAFSNDYNDLDNLPTLGTGNTNLTYTPSPTNGTVNSDTGTDATIPLADVTNAGLLTPAEKADIATALQPADITGFVPYTGATTNVDLGAFSAKASKLQLNTTASNTLAQGEIGWNQHDKTIDLKLNNNVTLQVGQEQNRILQNNTGGTLLNGRLVRVVGHDLGTEYYTINYSDNSSEATAFVDFMLTEDILDGGIGFGTKSGLVRDINTLGGTPSGVAYLGANGQFIPSPPPYPNKTVIIGFYGHISATIGEVLVDLSRAGQYNINTLSNAIELKGMQNPGIDQAQPILPIDIVIDTTTLTLTIVTVKGGQAITAANPIRFFTDGSGVITKWEKTSAVTFPAFTNTTGVWYFHFDSSGNPITTQTPWSDFNTISSIYRFYWNATLAGAARLVVQAFEAHTNSISATDHAWKHAQGSIYETGLEITHNFLSTGAPNADGRNTCVSLSTGRCSDDGLEWTVTNTPIPVNYFEQNMGNTTALSLTSINSGQFKIRTNDAAGLLNILPATRFPFLWNAGNNRPQFLTTLGVPTDVDNNNFFVYYIYNLADRTVGGAVKITSAEAQYTSLSLAQAHSWENMRALYATLKDNEIRPLYKLIFESRNAYDVAVKYSVLREIADIRTQRTTTSVASSGSTLASNVIFSPAGNIASTNVQNALIELDSEKQEVLVSGTNIKTINGASVLGSGDIVITGGSGDMVLADTQTISGLKTFLNGMFGLRNIANTFTSFFTNTNTASRTYTLQDRSGTIADLTDIASVNTNKMNVPTGGIASYLPKFLTATTMGLSRLWDTGTFFGIGTILSPTKDITLGNQSDRVVGIEDSDNMTKGRDLRSEAGRTVNFVPNNNFNAVSGGGDQTGFCSTTNGDVFYSVYGQIYKQTGGTGSFVSMAQTSRDYRGMCSVGADVYVVAYGGFIYKLTGGTGTLTAYESTNRAWTDIAYSPSGNLYATVTTSGNVYKQTALTGSFISLGLAAANYSSVSVSPANNIYIVSNNQLYKQTNEIGAFVAVSGLSQASAVCVSPTNSDVYVANYTGSLRKQTNETGSYNDISSLIGGLTFAWQTIDFSLSGNIYLGGAGATSYYVQINFAVGAAELDGGTKSEAAGTGKGTGKSLWQVWTGQKTTSGTNMQVLTKRIEVDENGYFQLLTMPTYADNTAALAGGLVAGQFYRTSTGILMITY